MAIVWSGQGINEGEVDGLSNAPEKMILRNQVVEKELIVEFRSELTFTHHGLLHPF